MTNENTAPAADAPAPAAKAKPAKRAAAAKPTTFTLADRAREKGISPKTARATFRRLFADAKAPKPKLAGKGDAWVFPTSERPKVDTILAAIDVSRD